MSSLSVGQAAPVFSLPDQNGEMVNLADFQGKKNVVLYFYPKAMTPGCTTQACGLRDSEAELAQRNTVVLGLSPDPSARLARFSDKQGLNFTLLSDEDHAVAEQYGAWGLKKFMGKTFMGILRSSFMLDKHGILIAVLDKVNTKTHHQDVLNVLDANNKSS